MADYFDMKWLALTFFTRWNLLNWVLKNKTIYKSHKKCQANCNNYVSSWTNENKRTVWIVMQSKFDISDAQACKKNLDTNILSSMWSVEIGYKLLHV